MIKSYFIIAWRNRKKNKIYSFINIFGLSTGLICCMLISLYIFHELSYDNYHKNAERLYQLGTTFIKDGKEDRTANTPAPMAQTMRQEFPEIENTARLLKTFADDKTLFRYTAPDNTIKSFNETNGYLADSSFFRMLNYKFKEGKPETALSNPNSVVLSAEIAAKIFGDKPALDHVIHISSITNGDYDFKVTGVFIPSLTPTHIDARFFMSLKGGEIEQYISTRTDLASNNMFYTYLLLKKGSNAKQLEAKFPAFIDRYAGRDLKAMGYYKKQFLIPVKDIHLYANTTANVTAPGSINSLYILASIAFFTLLIAIINFMNLSTARSSKRSAEVGVRKVLGADKNSLVRLFLGESLLMVMIAFVFALAITQSLLPLFGEVSGKEINFTITQYGSLIAVFFILAVVTGLIAGSYPAFYLSSFQPVKTLKGKFSGSLAAVSLRKTLVVFQFVISIVLIIAVAVITNQMHYMNSKDLGFAKDQQVIIPLRSPTAKNIYTILKAEIREIPGILSAGASKYYPGIFNPSDMPLYKENSDMNNSKRFFLNWVDDSFLITLDIKPAAGRLFSEEFPADTNYRIILNEEGIKEIGFLSAGEAVGKYVYVDWQGQTYKWEIIGVVKDFHFKGLHDAIQPYGFQLNNEPEYNYIIAHANSGSLNSVLKSIRNVWQKLNPGEPFEYSFLDDDFRKNYETETRLSSIINYFTIIAILISCLGLFGLAAFSAEQKTKEIGVRKVLGASISSIVTLLSKDFLKLVLFAIVIATPIAWYIMNRWLRDFVYRIEISLWILVAAWIIVLIIAFATVSFQALKAALANPVKSLKYE